MSSLKCTSGSIRIVQDQDSLLVKRRNENHSPGRCASVIIVFTFGQYISLDVRF